MSTAERRQSWLPALHDLRRQMAPFARPDTRKAIWQVLNTFVPYAALWVLLCYLVRGSYPWWTILPLLVLAALFLVRIFILFHDCTHSSFFASERANTVLGYVAGVLAFTPFDYWRHNHDAHHRSYADLDRRGLGDIWTLTVAEYRAASRRQRLAYRVARSPAVFLLIGPGYIFLIIQRLLHQWYGKNERRSVLLTNLWLAVLLLVASQTIGLHTYLVIQLPILLLAGAMGIWLFYIQHQFEGVYWARHAEWNPLDAALRGSSYYRLPRVLQWFSSNIGLHHVHHLLPAIPNYHLQQCYNAIPALREARAVTLPRSFKSAHLSLWDEQNEQLTSFRTAQPKLGDGKTKLNTAAS